MQAGKKNYMYKNNESQFPVKRKSVRNRGRLIFMVSNGKDAVVKVKHNRKTNIPAILSPVFSTKEQEEFFAKCAEKCMSTETRLNW